MQKQVYDTCRERRYFSPFETIIGYYEGENEQITKHIFSICKYGYGDITIKNVYQIWKKQQV